MDYKARVAALIADAAGIPADEAESLIEVPQEASMGDYALPCPRWPDSAQGPARHRCRAEGQITPPAWSSASRT